MSLAQVKSVIEKFVQNDRNDLLIIKGSWGVGKTYFWRNTVEKVSGQGKIGHKNYSYVSLFGIDSFETLKNSIIANQISSISIGKNVNTSESVLFSKLKNILKFAERIPYIRNFSGGLVSEFAFQMVKDSLICFDDLERRSDNFDIKDILGLASFLKEQRNCKIVFILNDEKLIGKETFGEHNEKVVDIEVNFAPFPNEVFDYVFDESPPYFELVKFSCLTLEIKNVRILQRIKRFIEDLLPHLKDKEQIVAKDVIRSIVLFVWSYYNKDEQSLTIPLEFLEDFLIHRLYFFKEKISSEEEKKYELLSKYGYEHTDELDKQLMLFVKKGFLNEIFFDELNQKNKQAIAQRGKDSYSEAWQLYRTNFDIDEEEFIEKLISGFRSNEEFLSVTDLYNTIDILRKLDRDKIANELIDEYVPQKVDYKTLAEMKRFPHFGDYKDTYFLEKLNQIPKPEVEYNFADALNELASNDYFFGEKVSFLASCDVNEYYNFFKNENPQGFYYLGKFLLKFGEVVDSNEEQQNIFNKTTEAFRKIAKEKRINCLRISDWFNIKVD